MNSAMRNSVLGFAVFALLAISAAADTPSAEGSNAATGVFENTIRNEVCGDGLRKKEILNPDKCTATFGAFKKDNIDLFQQGIQALVQGHLELSMKYLELANFFNQWNLNRHGFHDYFSKLSDEAWEDGVAIMQHMIKRGGALSDQFSFVNPGTDRAKKTFQPINFDNMCELTSLSLALKLEKQSVQDTLEALAHHEKPKIHSDPEFTHFLAEKLSDRHVLKVKHLANHVNSLSAALDSTPNAGLALHIYDTQLLK